MTFKDIRIFIINKIWKFVEDEDNFMVLKSNIRIYRSPIPIIIFWKKYIGNFCQQIPDDLLSMK